MQNAACLGAVLQQSSTFFALVRGILMAAADRLVLFYHLRKKFKREDKGREMGDGQDVRPKFWQHFRG